MSEHGDERLGSSGRPLALVVGTTRGARSMLEGVAERLGVAVLQAADLAPALAVLRAVTGGPDLILLHVSERAAKAVQFLARVREEKPFVPVVAVSEAGATAALEEASNLGAVTVIEDASDGVAIDRVRRDVARTIEEEAGLREAMLAVVHRTTDLSLPADPALVPRVVAFLGDEMRCHYPGLPVPMPDVKLALFEALANAVEHGSLEIGYERKSRALRRAEGLAALVSARRAKMPFGQRRVHVRARYGPERVEYVVRDEGRGFDPSRFDPDQALADKDRLHGRGLALIQHTMDEVTWNEAGNEIRLALRLERFRRSAEG